jgi:hypothetical protein
VRRPAFRDRLLAGLAGADQVVLLGDVVELRDSPLAVAIEAATPFFAELGEAAAGSRIVFVPGNHDHHLLATWLEQRRLRGGQGLGIEQIVKPTSGPLGSLARRARRAGAAEVLLAYPGLWVAEGIYATHGHYLDLHLTVPTFERLGVGIVQRLTGAGDDGVRRPDDYERIQAPLYGFLYALAQSGGAGGPLGSNPSARVWTTLSGGGGPMDRLRGLLLGSVALPGALAVAKRLGLGDFNADLSVGEIASAGVRAMGTAVERLGIEAEHVIYGHTHRRGPLPGEGSWRTATGARLHNAGSWVWSPGLAGRSARGSGFWPGTVAEVEPGEPPKLLHLLDDLDRRELGRLATESP